MVIENSFNGNRKILSINVFIEKSKNKMEHEYSNSQKQVVENFLALLTSFTRECGLCIVDEGGFIFRMVEGKPLVTVSKTFLQNLGDYPIVLTLDNQLSHDVVLHLDEKQIVYVECTGSMYRILPTSIKFPLHIQQLINKKEISKDEYKIFTDYLTSKNISIVCENIIGSILPVPASLVIEEDSPKEEKRVRVRLPSEDSSESTPEESTPEKSAESTPEESAAEDSEVESPPKKQSPERTKVKVVFFRKSEGDKSVCKMGDYVYRLKLVGGKNELTCLGRYDSRSNGWSRLSKKDVEIVKKLGYKIQE